jgi:hypothetical protein
MFCQMSLSKVSSAEFQPRILRVRYLDPEREMKNPEYSLRLFDALSPMIAVRPSARA